jgi:hypothetical protein
VIDYQTQQYRLFAGLATTNAHFFSANHLIKSLLLYRERTNHFATINTAELAQVNALMLTT